MIKSIVQRWVIVYVVAFVVLALGAFSYATLPREASPDVEIPFIMVSTPYPGVSPQDIESLVTNQMENELAGIDGLKKMNSTSAEGVSIVMLEFTPEIVIEDALQRVRDRVSRAGPKVPEDAEETLVKEISFSDMPIMIVTIAGDADEIELERIGKRLEDEFSRIPGVLDSELTGVRSREISVQIDPTRLEHYALSLDDVTGAIQSENVNIPGGDVAVGQANFLLRTPGEFTKPADLESVAIKRRGDRPVFVRDVAKVVDGLETRRTYTRLNGTSAISIGVKKRTGANILEVAEAVKAAVAESSKTWPQGVQWRVLGDQSKMIRAMVGDLENGILTALILVVIVLVFFMGVRNSLFVAIAIPLSFLMAILIIDMLGITLNMVVLFSLILALGMLVDNAIVIVENIYRHLEEGKTRVQAAIDGTREVAVAVGASTATTVAAFVPLLFWTGMMGEFMVYMPKTVITVLVCSLVVAVGVLPVLAANWMPKTVKPKPRDANGDLIPGPIMRGYGTALRWSIKLRYLVVFAGFAVLIGTFMFYGRYNFGTEFMPETEPDRAVIAVTAPDGTDLEETDTIVRQVEAVLAEEKNVDVFVAEIGVSGDANDPASGSQSSANSARITVDFLPAPTSANPGDLVRVESTALTVERIRQALEGIAGATVSIEKERMGPPVGAPIAVEVSGEDFHEVGAYAARIRRDLGDIPGVAKLKDNYKVGRPELRFHIDRGAAKRVGASTRAVASTIRTAVAGTKATALRDGEDEYDVIVELAPQYRDDLQAISGLRIPGREDTSPDTFAVPLSAVARWELAGGSGPIRHVDQDIVISIEGEIAEGFNQNAVRQSVNDWIENTTPPPGFAARLGGANDEQRETQEFLGKAAVVCVVLIAVVLISQFNSVMVPVIILASVVLSLIGVLWGLLLTGTAFGVLMTGLGTISLAGVVVNNAILLLDYVQQLQARGMDLVSALVRAGTARFRPVMLTALTTILGLVPMAIGKSFNFVDLAWEEGTQTSQWWGPMAVAVIFGLAVATVLTLGLVPTMYAILEDLRRLFKVSGVPGQSGAGEVGPQLGPGPHDSGRPRGTTLEFSSPTPPPQHSGEAPSPSRSSSSQGYPGGPPPPPPVAPPMPRASEGPGPKASPSVGVDSESPQPFRYLSERSPGPDATVPLPRQHHGQSLERADDILDDESRRAEFERDRANERRN